MRKTIVVMIGLLISQLSFGSVPPTAEAPEGLKTCTITVNDKDIYKFNAEPAEPVEKDEKNLSASHYVSTGDIENVQKSQYFQGSVEIFISDDVMSAYILSETDGISKCFNGSEKGIDIKCEEPQSGTPWAN